MSGKRNNTAHLDALLASVTEDMLGGDFSETYQDRGLRVERILLELVRPDPVQPRRVMPEELHHAFHNNRMTPTQALRSLVQLVQVTARQGGRPFNHVLELLPNADDNHADEGEIKRLPEETLLRDLVNLAVTIRDDGQVNPLTVVDVSHGVTQQYRIETGERRYWATWLLRDFLGTYSGDGMIPCIVIPAEQASIFRQAKENTARVGLSAIAMARQAALLLLTVHGYEIPMSAVNNDFYRQALDLDLRGKREYTDAILSAMGGVDKARFSRLKALLNLSDEALELADRYDIDEKKLRYLLTLPNDYHGEIVRQIIDFGLTSKQVQELCQGDQMVSDGEDLTEKLPASAVKIAKAVQNVNLLSAQDLARALIAQEGDANIALARLKAMGKLLEEAERFLAD